MAINTLKFSQFVNGGALQSNNTIVGLKSSLNTAFTANTLEEFSWQTVTTTPFPMFGNNGYVPNNNSSIVQFVLPVTSNFGDEIAISGMGSALFRITQGAGQSIIISPNITTVGVTGSVTSVNQYGSLRLVCIVANLTWTTTGGVQDIFTIV